MDNPIIELMHECVAKLSIQGKNGTGFFVAPGLILTCAHVVGDLKTGEFCKNDIHVRWKHNDHFAAAKVIPEKWLPDLDIALLAYAVEHHETPPCVLLGRVCRTNDFLVTFGYPNDSPNGDPATFDCKGYTGDDPPLIRFKLDNIRSGMSGSPVLNMETKWVCGMVKFTVDPNGIRGGGGVTGKTILENFGELAALQEQHHQKDTRWYAKIGVKTPGDLTDVVKHNIAEELEEPRLQVLTDGLSKTFKKQRGTVVRTAPQIASNLLKIEITGALLLLYMAQTNTVAELEKKNAGDETIQFIQKGVFDILGWLVLLAVNDAWLSQNRNNLYPEHFPGAIELPVKKDTGIEIIHAAMNKRCARFDFAKGTLFGAYRIPADNHKFLEAGISTKDVVTEIKKSIYIYLNKDWNKEKIPGPFTADENEDLNAQLQWFNGLNKSRYLVVQRSESACLLTDEVYKTLMTDLPDLQVIFHNTEKQGAALNVSEINLSRKLENFFVYKKEL